MSSLKGHAGDEDGTSGASFDNDLFGDYFHTFRPRGLRFPTLLVALKATYIRRPG